MFMIKIEVVETDYIFNVVAVTYRTECARVILVFAVVLQFFSFLQHTKSHSMISFLQFVRSYKT